MSCIKSDFEEKIYITIISEQITPSQEVLLDIKKINGNKLNTWNSEHFSLKFNISVSSNASFVVKIN